MDKKIRLNGLIITSKKGKIKISVDHANAPYILDGTVKTKVKATRVDQIINIHNNGCEAGKDFYYDGENLYLGDVKNISIARRNYLDTQQVYLFLCGAE
ncbi:MAG: hypothetical protein K6E76_02590 [Patescibacteria group bacterium]|nr:hypothetical protein [Patescibacteria group bacterium]